MKTITITTEKMYRNFANSHLDIIWDEPEDAPYQLYAKLVKILASEKMEELRQLFIEGYTVMMMGELMSQIDYKGNENDEHEIRVINRAGKLIGVVIDSEINY